MKKVLILGGGASGLMAAIQAAGQGASVTLLEHNETPGKKLLATGNGRCNLTNEALRAEAYHCGRTDFPMEVIRHFPLEETLQFFEKLGIGLKNRRGGYYPRSEQAASVLEVLRLEASYRKVKIKTREEVTEILPQEKGFLVKTEGWSYPADAVICCLGSPASGVSGSSSTGARLAAGLGHQVIPFAPALVGLRCRGSFSSWAGIRTEGSVTLWVEDQICAWAEGELQLTEYGISGIPVFQVSGAAVRASSEKKKTFLQADFFPEYSEQELAALLARRQEDCPYKTIEQLFCGLLPGKLVRVLFQGGRFFGRSGASGEAADAGGAGCFFSFPGAGVQRRCFGSGNFSGDAWNPVWYPGFILPGKWSMSMRPAEDSTCSGPGPAEPLRE